MSTFNIQWSSASLQSLAEERYAQFYALVHRGQVVLLGKAHREDIASMIPACLTALNLDPLGVTVHLGRITGVGHGHVSNRTVDAILSALVFAGKPSLNRVGKYRHEPVMDMQVSNVGLPGLPNQLRVQDGRVIVAAKPSAVYSVPAC